MGSGRNDGFWPSVCQWHRFDILKVLLKICRFTKSWSIGCCDVKLIFDLVGSHPDHDRGLGLDDF